MARCTRCGRELDSDDIGAYLKFCDRNATSYLCIGCFCQDLQCPESYLRERIEFLRRHGCALFPKKRSPQ